MMQLAGRDCAFGERRGAQVERQVAVQEFRGARAGDAEARAGVRQVENRALLRADVGRDRRADEPPFQRFDAQ